LAVSFVIMEFGEAVSGVACGIYKKKQLTLEAAQRFAEQHYSFGNGSERWYWWRSPDNPAFHYGTTSPASVGRAYQVIIQEVEDES
jgi:hypothetical protein